MTRQMGKRHASRPIGSARGNDMIVIFRRNLLREVGN